MQALLKARYVERDETLICTIARSPLTNLLQWRELWKMVLLEIVHASGDHAVVDNLVAITRNLTANKNLF
jgi:hypothetical protein